MAQRLLNLLKPLQMPHSEAVQVGLRFLLALGIFLIGSRLSRDLSRLGVAVELVVFSHQASGLTHTYTNGSDEPRLRVVVRPDSFYVLPLASSSEAISSFRFDPPQGVGATQFYLQVRVKRSGHEPLYVPPNSELIGCTGRNATIGKLANAFKVNATGESSIVECSLKAVENTPDSQAVNILVGIGLFALLMPLMLLNSALIKSILALSLALYSVPYLPVSTVASWLSTDTVAVTGVGPSVYLGPLKSHDTALFVAYSVLVLGVSVLVLLCFQGFRTLWRRGLAIPNNRTLEKAEGVGSWLPLAIAMVGCAVLTVPNLSDYGRLVAESAPPVQSYDSTNFIAWLYQSYLGNIPLKDFWFPYSFHHWRWGPTPSAVLMRTLENILFGFVLAACSRRMLRMGTWGGAIVGVLGFFLVFDGFLPGRFLGHVTFLLYWIVFVATVDRPSFVVACGLSLVLFWAQLLDLTSALLVGVAVAVTLVVQAILDRKGPWLRRLIVTAAIFGGAGVLFALFVWKQGAMPGLIMFLEELSDETVYSSQPAAISSWPQLALASAALLFNGVMLGAVLLVAQFLREGRRVVASPSWCLVLTCGAFFGIVLTKQVMRSGIEFQILPFVTVVFLLYVVSQAQASVARSWLYVALIMLIADLYSPSVTQESSIMRRSLVSVGTIVGTGVGTVGSRLDSLVSGLVSERATTAEQAPKYAALAAKNFFQDKPDAQAAISFIADQLVTKHLYVFGDEVQFYFALRKPLPYYQTIYNASPASRQKRICDGLIEQRLDTVVVVNTIDPGYGDEVPHAVRMTLVLGCLARNFEPVRKFGPYLILRAKNVPVTPSGDEIEQWHPLLSTKLHLGLIPAVTAIRKSSACELGEAGCEPVVSVSVSDMTPREKRSARKRSIIYKTKGGEMFEISFTTKPRQSDYVIALSHLWFYEASGMVLPSTEPGMEVSVIGRRIGGVLF